MIDAKLAGVGIEEEAAPIAAQSNVIDLMAALKKSLGGSPAEKDATPAANPKLAKKVKASKAEEARKQPAFKLPIEGGKKTAVKKVEPVKVEVLPAARTRRKAS